ncbi:unnamed protein product [Pleuronectes platessa]|uniref:Uncharacterized protein n=1 Tax=Pleuronectes platessa TaxID=8262 RepID=A0A9N7USB9_PLEPL|nr:unnamed protein product [Pleuronectes platessa]
MEPGGRYCACPRLNSQRERERERERERKRERQQEKVSETKEKKHQVSVRRHGNQVVSRQGAIVVVFGGDRQTETDRDTDRVTDRGGHVEQQPQLPPASPSCWTCFPSALCGGLLTQRGSGAALSRYLSHLLVLFRHRPPAPVASVPVDVTPHGQRTGDGENGRALGSWCLDGKSCHQ